MTVFKRSVHLGTNVPLIETDDIDNKTITKDKLAEKSVGWNELDEDFKRSITTVEGVVVPLTKEWGDSENVGINQKTLTEKKNEIEASIGTDESEGTIKGRIKSIEDSIGTDETEGTIKERITTLETAVDTGGSVDERIATAKSELIGEATEAGNTLKKIEDRTTTLEETVGSGGDIDTRIAAAKSEVVGDATSDYDTLGKVEDNIQALDNAKADKATTLAEYGITDAYTKSQVNGLITTPNQEYVTVTATDQTTAVTDVLPTEGSADTIYRVGNWDGTQYDITVYSEYAWDGTQYVHLSTKTQIGEVFDISAYRATGGTLATYADLAAALANDNVPTSIRRGGMSVKFVQSSDNKYMQYRYMETDVTTAATFTNVANWQGVDDEPTAGSDNLVKSGGIALQISQLGQDVNNISDILNGGEEEIKTPQTPLSTSGHINCATAEIGQAFNRTIVASYEGAACWRIPVSISEKYEIRAKGTSNSFALYVLTGNNDIVLAKEREVNSKTNGIVLTITENGYLYVNDEEYSIIPGNIYKVTTQYNDGLIKEVDDINTFLGNPIEGGTLAALLNAKVDKVTGKSLIDANVAESINFIQESEWIDVKTDSENKILEGTKTDGTKVIESPLELQGVRQETIYNPEFIQVITDSEGKVIEATKKDGKKVFYGGVESVDSIIQSVNIPLLDANFTSPIPCVITGTKGSETAKYDFETSLGKDSFNIRIKFRVTDNLLNRETTAQVLKLGNVIINAIPTPLSQFSTSEIYNELPVTMLWPDFNGGVKYGVSTQYKLGQYAFYIKYIGSEDSASVENDGTKLTIKSGSTTTEFPFSTYSTVSSLYNALKALTDIEVDFKEVESRTTDELALFPECQLKLTCYTRTGGSEQGEIEEYVDTPPFFIPYAVDDSWHQVEIVKIGTYIYCACDGATQIIPYDNSIDYSTLTLGDGNKILFKDLNINLKSADDAEFYANGSRIVSSVNPAIIIFEGHGMYDGIIDSEAPDQLATSIDRLYYVFEKMQSMGYIPVSINDIAEYYAGNKDLPKRCYSIVFDDFRWENCLNAKYRKVFKELYVYPALAIITDRDVAITHNGENITKKEAAEICLRNDFGLLSHTRNHWKLDSVRLTTLISECMQDIYSADDCLVDGMILVYPGGRHTKYSDSTLKWLGYSLGIGIAKSDNNYASNQKDTNKYALIRVEIGVRSTLDIILNKII